MCWASTQITGQLGGNGAFQQGFAGEAEDIFDRVRLAPAHQRLAGEAAIGPEQDAHAWPAAVNLAHNALDLLAGTGAGIDVGAAQRGRQQMATAEHVERQISVAA